MSNGTSILSFPERGPWGKSNWRGNCSGYVYKELFEFIKPSHFCDPMVGSGTSIEVARDMGIEAVGLDLHMGFNILRDSILDRLGRETDFCCSHPPYGNMVQYSGRVWGSEPHPDDLSLCTDDEDFHQKLQAALLNQREATKVGGVYGTIIGDWRRNGVYTSYQAECIARMPKNEILGVLIKQQHHTMSGLKTYRRMSLPFIAHEYIILWTRKGASTFALLRTVAVEQAQRLRGTWRSIVRTVMISLGGRASIKQVCERIAQGAPEQMKTNSNWEAKVRQVLNSTGEYRNEERGVWALA